MATGLRTHLSATTPHVLLVGLLLLEPELPLTLLAGAGSGVGRATMLPTRLLSARRGQWDRRLDRELIWLVPLSTLVCGLSAWVLLGTLKQRELREEVYVRRWWARFACVSVFVPMWLVLTGFGAFAKVTSCYDRSNPDAIVGTQKAETLRGTAGDDIILGLGGNDVIRGLGGDDLLCGGRGDDKVVGGQGNDRVEGGAGSDVLSEGPGRGLIFGGSGDDRVEGGTDHDHIYGGRGDDVLRGGLGSDSADFTQARRAVRIDLRNGTAAGEGRDSLSAIEEVWGSVFGDVLAGTWRGGKLVGYNGDDMILGRGGEDRLWGDHGDDTLDGGRGDDRLKGGGGTDALDGGAGEDELDGDGGNDSCVNGESTTDCES